MKATSMKPTNRIAKPFVREKKKGEPQEQPPAADKDLNILLSYIFKKSFSVWQRYNGNVPDSELEALDLAGDWPKGVARAAMERLNFDKELREQVREMTSYRC